MINKDYIEYVVAMKKDLQMIAKKGEMQTLDVLLFMALDFIATKELFTIYEENEEDD